MIKEYELAADPGFVWVQDDGEQELELMLSSVPRGSELSASSFSRREVYWVDGGERLLVVIESGSCRTLYEDGVGVPDWLANEAFVKVWIHEQTAPE